MEVLDKYDHVEIRSVEGESTPLYTIVEPKLTDKEADELAKWGLYQEADFKKIVRPPELQMLKEEPDVSARWEMLRAYVAKKLPASPNREYLIKRIVGVLLGYDELSLLADDDNLEEIMVNGIRLPVYVYHRKYGMCKTSIVFPTEDALNRLIYDICYVNNREIKPIIDIAALDGNRINITAEPLPSKGSTITIRKQRKKIFSIIELIQQRTLSLSLAAFLWLAIEGMKLTPANIAIAGSIGGGKTTTLNALCTFIPPNERVITIEDTLELNLDNLEDKVQLEAKGEYDMDALLRDTLRMRADRIIVGEIRGKEAITLFNAMNIGRIGMGTIHASSAREVTARLQNSPMNVPSNVVASLDLILVQNKFVHNGQVIRRVTEVAEVTGAIKDTILMGSIYEWDPKTDQVARSSEHGLTTPILFLDKLASATKFEKSKIIKELELREAVLAYMLRNGISDQERVKNFIKRFYVDLQGLIRSTPDLFGKPPQSPAKTK